MKLIIIGAVLVAAAVGGAGYLVAHKSSYKAGSNNTGMSTDTSTPAAENSTDSQSATEATPKSTTSSKSSSSSSTPKSSSSSGGSSSSSGGSTTPSPLSVTVHANDSSASPSTITAKSGQKVNITFAVSSEGTYHGGLEFVSADPSIDSGAIDPGESKTVSFTATKSFKFTPYWYASHVQKGYYVTVTVQ